MRLRRLSKRYDGPKATWGVGATDMIGGGFFIFFLHSRLFFFRRIFLLPRCILSCSAALHCIVGVVKGGSHVE